MLHATNMLVHRGPDGGGYWQEPPFFFGHRRLAIIDLVSGAQPMADAQGRFVITHNGEIYNYRELRAELETLGSRFRTESDTEVILEAYRHFGVHAASKLLGMFAFAIADRQERTLYLARDRLGEKPLYVWEMPSGAIAFASELKALSCLPSFDKTIDPAALGGYTLLNYVPGCATLFQGVSRLQPGTWLRTGADGERTQNTYWTPSSRDSIGASTPDGGPGALDELRARIDESVRIALRSDVPVTLFLSGGIDSSIVAESATRQGYLQHAYCLDFEERGFSEWKNAEIVAKTLGLELRRAVASCPSPEEFERLIFHADDPLADSSAVPVAALAADVAKDYKVAISGDGGDEIFAGYLTYQASALFKHLRGVLPARVAHAAARRLARMDAGSGKVSTVYKAYRFLRAWGLQPAAAHFSWNGAWLPEEAQTLIADRFKQGYPIERALDELLTRLELSRSPDLRALQSADMQEYLPNDILTKVDRMTMAYGLESRAPLLAPAVAEFGLALNSREKAGVVGQPKRILRALAGKVLPQEIARARKQGFSIPIHTWLRTHMRDSVESFLSHARLGNMPFLDTDAVLERKRRHQSGIANLGFELWGLMALSAWWTIHSDVRSYGHRDVSDLVQLTLPPHRTPGA